MNALSSIKSYFRLVNVLSVNLLLLILYSCTPQIVGKKMISLKLDSQKPSAFTVTSAIPSFSQIVLSWPNVNNATSYNVEYGTTSGLYTTSIVTSSTTYTMSSLTNTTTYFIRVSAVNSKGITSADEINSTTTSMIVIPTSPLSLVATNNDVSPTLAWAAPATGDAPITYNVYRGTSSGGPYTILGQPTPATLTNYSDTVVPGTNYYYVVYPVNAGGSGSPSAELYFKPIAAFNLSSVSIDNSVGANALKVSWPNVTGASSYDIYYGTTSGNYTGSGVGVTSPYTISSLTAGTTYYIKVNAKNVTTSQMSTNELTGVPLATPAITKISSVDNSSVKVIWSATTGATSYNVLYGQTTGSYSGTGVGATSPYTISSLVAGQNEFAILRAINSNGLLDSSEANGQVYNSLSSTMHFDSASYTVSNSNLIDVNTSSNSLARLLTIDQIDDSTAGTSGDLGFQSYRSIASNISVGANKVSMVAPIKTYLYNSTGALDATWTPKWANMVGYWPLDGASGSLNAGATITATVGPNGTVDQIGASLSSIESLQRIEGMAGQAIHFGGSDFNVNSSARFIRIPNTGGMATITNTFTISAWVLVENTSSEDCNPNAGWNYSTRNAIFSSLMNNELGSFHFEICGGRLAVATTNSSGQGWSASTEQYTVTDGIWHHVALIKNGTGGAGSLTFYIDGYFSTTVACEGVQLQVCETVGDFSSVAGDWAIGATSFSNGGNFLGHKGLIDEVAVWNTPLTEAELQKITSGQGYKFYNQSNLSDELSSTWTPQYANLVGYWKLNETSGTTFSDSGNGTAANGSCTNCPTLGKYGKLSYAPVFKAQNTEQIFISDQAKLNISDEITYSAWFRTNSSGSAIIERYNTAMQSTYPSYGNISRVMIDELGRINFQLVQASDNSPVYIDTYEPYNDGNWHLVTTTYKSSEGIMRIYVDGQLKRTAGEQSWDYHSLTSGLMTGPIASSSEGLVIGGWGAMWTTSLGAQIDEVAVWHKQLTASEIASIYNRQASKFSGEFLSRIVDTYSSSSAMTSLTWLTSLPFNKEIKSSAESGYSGAVNNFGNGLALLYHFDETSDGVVTDSSGNNRNSTIIDNGGAAASNYTGLFNKAYFLDGKGNQYIETSSSFTFGNNFSFCLWMDLKDQYQTGMILSSSWHINPVAGVQFFVNTDDAQQTDSGNLYLRLETSDGTNPNAVLKSRTPLQIGRWNQVCVTADKVAGTGKIYINGVDQTHSNKSSISTTFLDNRPLSIGEFFGDSGGSAWGNLLGLIDEFAIWTRQLTAAEVLELYKRGANRVKLQVRSCANSDCSDDVSNNFWQGTSGATGAFLSELLNITVNPPNLVIAPSSNRYYQYRAVLESDDITYMPDLTKVKFGPDHFASGQTVINNTPISFDALTTFTQGLGGNGCSGGVSYQLSTDNSTWQYWNGSAWVTASSVTNSNNATVVNTNISGFSNGLGALGVNQDLYIKSILNTDGTTQCELDSVSIGGYKY